MSVNQSGVNRRDEVPFSVGEKKRTKNQTGAVAWRDRNIIAYVSQDPKEFPNFRRREGR